MNAIPKLNSVFNSINCCLFDLLLCVVLFCGQFFHKSLGHWPMLSSINVNVSLHIVSQHVILLVRIHVVYK